MTEKDLKQFTRLMFTIGEMCSGNESMKNPSDMKIMLYFTALKDLTLDSIANNAAQYFKNNRQAFYPTIADLRNEPDPEDVAREIFEKFQDTINCYYYEGFASSNDIVVMKLKERGLEDTIPYLDSYGVEIVNNDNITATRAQFVKAYTAHKRIEVSHQQLERSKDTQKIGDVLKKIMLTAGNDND